MNEFLIPSITESGETLDRNVKNFMWKGQNNSI